MPQPHKQLRPLVLVGSQLMALDWGESFLVEGVKVVAVAVVVEVEVVVGAVAVEVGEEAVVEVGAEVRPS